VISTSQFNRLNTAIDYSRRQMEHSRRERVDSIRQLVGRNYADDGNELKMPVNFLKLAIDTHVRSLAARSPRALFSTDTAELRPIADNFEIAVNLIPDEIGLTKTLRRFVLESLFTIGVVRVGLQRVGKILGVPYGVPFVEVVTSDDYFVDMSAKNWNQIQFQGHDYWVNEDELLDSELLKKGQRERIENTSSDQSDMGDNGQKRADSISSGGSPDEYKRRRHLRDVWLADEGLLVTYEVPGKVLLNQQEWNGPDRGPYHTLGYSDVPGNLLPLPPVAVWKDLHELANVLFRKLGRGAEKFKRCLGFQGNDPAEIDAYRKASDGDGFLWTGAEPKVLAAGGADPATMEMFLQTKGLFSYFANNLDSIGGLATQSETVGQDKLLSEAAGAQLRQMASNAIDVYGDIFRALAWYEWHDPIKNRVLQKKVSGIDVSIPTQWNRDTKVGSFNQYELKIDVYSLIDDSPSLKLQRLGMIMQQYIVPFLPMIQQMGGSIDFQKVLRLVAKYSDFNELDDIVIFPDNVEAAQHSGQQAKNRQADQVRSASGMPASSDDSGLSGIQEMISSLPEE